MDLFKGLVIRKFHCSSCDERFVVVSGDSYFETNAVTVELIEALSEAETINVGVTRFLERHDEYSREQILAIVADVLIPKIQSQKEIRTPFLFSRQLVAAGLIDRLTDRLSFLFDKRLFVSLLALGIVAIIAFFALTDGVFKFGNTVDAGVIAGMLLFVFVSSFFHELGHASALKYFGLKHGGIGFGLYLTFPVLYTDVTAAWQLQRRQRCVVNMAGVYFQTIIVLFLIGAYFLTGDNVLRYLVLTTVLGFVLTLNPFFKFDGYWMMSDLLGVSNLREKTQGITSYVFRKAVGKSVEPHRLLSQISRKMRIAVVLYTIAVNVFMAYYFLYLIPVFVYSFVEKFPDEFMRLVTCLSNSIVPPMALVRNLATQLLFMALIVYMVYRVGSRFLVKKKSVA